MYGCTLRKIKLFSSMRRHDFTSALSVADLSTLSASQSTSATRHALAMQHLRQAADEEPPEPLAAPLDLLNHAVPPSVQQRGYRLQYRKQVMMMLYDGSWRYQHQMTRAYGPLAAFIKLCVCSAYATATAVLSFKMMFLVEFLLSWMVRMRNPHHIVPCHVALSLYVYHYGCSHKVMVAMLRG